MMTVHASQLRKLCPFSRLRGDILADVNEVLFDYCISDTPARVAHFFAQVMHETNALSSLRENMDLSAERIAQRWPRIFADLREALPYAHHPMALANKVYRGRLGNYRPHDGWRFVTRGLLPITGRAMYERISRSLDVDFTTDPDLIIAPANALPAACEVWNAAGGNELADRNDITGLTRAIRGCTSGMASRWNWLLKTREIWPQQH